MRVASKPLLKTFKVYFSCRLPDIGDGMMKCSQCLEHFYGLALRWMKTTYLKSGTVSHALKKKCSFIIDCIHVAYL